MSHHGTDPFDEPERLEKLEALKKKLLDTAAFRGSLGDFPEGQLTKMDEGAIQFAIGEKDGKVVIDFGKPVVWIGFDRAQALEISDTLRKHAERL